MPTKPTGNPVGRPKFKPTPEQIAAVQVLTACGFTQADIAAQVIDPTTGLGISEKTLRARMREALDTGKAGANALVARSLFKKATGNGPQSVQAAIFWLKTQAGWKEPAQGVELSAPGGGPIQMQAAPVDLSKLSTEELLAFESIMLKLGAPQAAAALPPPEA